MILAAQFDHLQESFSFYEDIQLKKMCLPVRNSCPPDENVNEASGYLVSNKDTCSTNGIFSFWFSIQY